MGEQTFRIRLLADSTIDPLTRFLGIGHDDRHVSVAPYDQVRSELTEDGLTSFDLAVAFTQIDKLSAEIGKALQYRPFDRRQVLADVEDFARQVCNAARHTQALAVYNWTMPTWTPIAEMAAWRGSHDLHRLVTEANVALADAVGGCEGVYLLDQTEILLSAGEPVFDPKMWAIGKVIYSRGALAAFARQIGSVIDALRGRSRKLIVLDLDNTLWGGIVGDDGWRNVRIGGLDPIGEAYQIFQKQLKALRNRGVLLAIVSKNNQQTALEAIRKHPEMVLTCDDLVGWRINWHDKAENIADLVDELSLGLQSVVFIDDNPHERDRVRTALPDVLVPDWPADPAMYAMALRKLACFETPRLSEEDRRRTAMYRQERDRAQTLDVAESKDAWLKKLNLTVTTEPLDDTNLPRAVQLLNKTNQFNLTTRRTTESAYRRWADEPAHRVLVFHVEDKFGRSGLVGLLGLATHADDRFEIVDWVLSCRVLGRGVESAMLAVAADMARSQDLDVLTAEYVPSPKNAPIMEFLQHIPHAQRSANRFVISTNHCRCPKHVKLKINVPQEAL